MSSNNSPNLLKNIPHQVVLHKLITPLAYVETVLLSLLEKGSPLVGEELAILKRAETALRRSMLLLEVYLALQGDSPDKSTFKSLEAPADPSAFVKLVEDRLTLKKIKPRFSIAEDPLSSEIPWLYLYFLLSEYILTRSEEGILEVEIKEEKLSAHFQGRHFYTVLPERDFEGALLQSFCEVLGLKLLLIQDDDSLKISIAKG